MQITVQDSKSTEATGDHHTKYMYCRFPPCGSKTISGSRSLTRIAYFKRNKMKKVTFLLCQALVLASGNVFLNL